MCIRDRSGNALLMVILGGLGSLAGAVVGAASFVLLSEGFQSLTRHWQLLLGGFIIAAVALLPHGLVGGAAALRRRLRRTSDRIPAPAEPKEIAP